MEGIHDLEKIAVIAKSEEGTFHQVLLTTSQMKKTAVFIATLFDDAVPVTKKELESITF